MNKANPVTFVSYQLEGRQKNARGRMAFCLAELIAAGSNGITTIDYPGARISEYLRRLRNDGLDIETKRVAHKGPYPGSHGVFRLRSTISAVEIKTASMDAGGRAMIAEPRFTLSTVVTAAVAPAIAKLTAIYADAAVADNSRLRGQTLLALARLRAVRRTI
jgi:hypothetical protein